MRYMKPGLACAGIALLLVACGGGSERTTPQPSNGGPNTPPTANAGTSRSVTSGVPVTLNGPLSSDSDGTIVSYAWTQTAGTAVSLSSATIAQPSFIAPQVAATATLSFSLTVTDDDGASSTAATVSITVNPAVAGNVNVTGRITF